MNIFDAEDCALHGLNVFSSDDKAELMETLKHAKLEKYIRILSNFEELILEYEESSRNG